MTFTLKLLFQKWVESLSFLRGKDGLISLFSTVQTFKRSVKLLRVHFIILLLLTAFIVFGFDIINSGLLKGVVFLALAFYSGWFWVKSLLTVRPSIELKDRDYFIKYRSKMFGLVFLVLMMIIPLMIITLLAGNSSYFIFILPVLSSFLLFGSFFFMDDSKGIRSVLRSIKNGYKLTLYFLPVVFLSLGFQLLLGLYFSQYKIWSVISIPLNLFVLSFVSVLYTKIKHSNYNLFFKS